jgi:microtubule-associated protein-like 6
MHPNMIYAATGDIGEVPKICIWDTVTTECLARISGLLTKGIAHLCFSPDGSYLAASAIDENHCVAIYNWDKCTNASKNVANKSKKNNNEALISADQLTTAHVFYLLFTPSGDQLIATALGEVNFISFWGGAVKVFKGEYAGSDKRPDAQAILCAAYLGTALVTGCFDGKLIIWKGKKLNHYLKAHEGPVNAIWGRPNLDTIITGSSDGTVKLWDQRLNQIKLVNTNVEVRKINIAQDKSINSLNAKVKSVCEKSDGNILVGTRGGDIIEITKNNPKMLIRSHFKHSLRGLVVNPKKLEYVTIDQGGVFSVWDIEIRKHRLIKKLECGGDGIAFSSDGKMLSVGLLNGEIQIYNSEYKATATRKNTSSAIFELKFSPDNLNLIASTADSRIYLYDVSTKFSLIRKFKTIGTITHIDFSENGKLIQTVTASGKFNCFTLDREKATQDIGSVKWKTYNCPLLEGAHNIFKETVSCVDRSHDEEFSVSGDIKGSIRLVKFPCLVKGNI